MISDEPVLFQSSRFAHYARALEQLRSAGLAFRCTCSRAQLAAEGEPGGTPVYPGTCRGRDRPEPAAWRFRVEPGLVQFTDRAQGPLTQEVAAAVGDFVVRRSDGLWAYQLAVVVDDAAQGITHVVRGADLLENTPRQLLLMRALGLPEPSYLHVPLVRDAAGRKLSKSEGALGLDRDAALAELGQAWAHLGFAPVGGASIAEFQQRAVGAWAARWPQPRTGAAGVTP